MANKNKPGQRGLGRGLSALMADVKQDEQTGAKDAQPARRADQSVPIERVVPNPDQPRRRFSQEALEELSESIRAKGIIQPLIVRKKSDDKFEIVAGERRWRAAQMAQLHEVPIVVREFSDVEVLEIAIIENIQRADLNPVEEAVGYSQLMDKFGHTQEKLASALGKSRSHIANLLRLLQLPQDVQDLLQEGKLTIGHARALITTDDPSALAKLVVAKGLSVREAEKLAKGPKKATSERREPSEKDADTRALENDLTANLGMTVAINSGSDPEQGQLVISYKSLDDLDELCRILSSGDANAIK